MLGNIAYIVWEDGKLARENAGIPDFHWDPDMQTKAKDLKGVEFKLLKNNLYSLTGTIRENDCEKVVSELPGQDTPFVVILESPGGSLFEGGCIASHFKIRKVITVVRDTPIIDEEGNILYTPGLVKIEGKDDDKVVCASSCSLIFLGGDLRYLIGNVFLGIHAPRTPDEIINSIGKRALESEAYRSASALLLLLKNLGIEESELRLLFIQIPAASMYWLSPRDFKNYPRLITFATHYRDFWGFNSGNLQSEAEI